MIAVIKLQGKQYKVREGDRIIIDHLEVPAGTEIKISDVLLLETDDGVKIGSPNLKKVEVTGRVLRHQKGKKIIVFKMRRRKHFRKKKGHRQLQSVVEINAIKEK